MIMFRPKLKFEKVCDDDDWCWEMPETNDEGG